MNPIKPTILAVGLSFLTTSTLAHDSKCPWPEGLHNEVNSLKAEHVKTPGNGETLLQLSTTYQAIGIGKKALEFADKAIEQMPKSGSAQVAKVHALHLLGRVDESLALANKVYFDQSVEFTRRGMKSWLRHSMLGIYLESGKLKTAEQMIMKQFPDVLDLMDKPVEPLSLKLGIPIHTLEPLIYIYRNTGRAKQADRLARHLTGFSAMSFFELEPDKLQASQHWLLASLWAGVPLANDKIVASLRRAYDQGFSMGWRFNYAHHPVYWPLHQDAGFVGLIKRIEGDMEKARRCLVGG
ncbi:MAG: hypothetical protein HRT35_07030 [Algicola sp.]|nr:hypothetical protein [Algicola sp.]